MTDRQNPTTAAVYARVSSDRQDVDLSVAAQLRALREYAERNGFVIVRQYVDEAESGRVADRPQFRRMIDEGGRPTSPFEVILVWKFSRFTRKREHAVAFKSMLRKKGIRVVSITEHADDTPTGKLMEAIIESVDEFYSENLAQEVLRGMRESASRGFWMPMLAPYGYRKVHVQDGAKKRPKLELDPPADAVVRRMFDMALHGSSTLDIAKALNAEGIPSPFGAKWLKATIFRMLSNEVYTGTLVWGKRAKDNVPPVRVEDAFPAIVSKQEFKRVARSLGSRAPGSVHPRRISSPYLLSGLLKCERCGRALSASESGRGRYTYYVCHSLLNRGKGTCTTPRLSAKRFERLIVEQIREHILTESNMRDLVRMVNEEMDSVIAGERERLEAAELELREVRQRMNRLWELVEKTEMTVEDILPRIRHHQENQERLERAADEARVELDARLTGVQDAEVVAAYAREMGEWLLESGLAETKAFLRTFVREIVVRPGHATIHYTVPTPDDSPIGGADVAEVALGRRFMKSVSRREPVEPRFSLGIGSAEGRSPLPGARRCPPQALRAGGWEGLRCAERGCAKYTGCVKRAGRPLRRRRGGKSGLRRAGCWVTPRRSDATESATETIAPMASRQREGQARVKRCGKSAPGPGESRDAGKPHPEQGQIEGLLPSRRAAPGCSSPGRPHDPSGNGGTR